MNPDTNIIQRAWHEEASITSLGLRPAADKAIQAALIPGGGNWECVAPDGAITRSIMWGRVEVANINPAGSLGDDTEGQIAMGMRATPVMDKALRCIFVLARDPSNLELIGKIARAAIDCVEMPAPRISEPEEDGDDVDGEDC